MSTKRTNEPSNETSGLAIILKLIGELRQRRQLDSTYEYHSVPGSDSKHSFDFKENEGIELTKKKKKKKKKSKKHKKSKKFPSVYQNFRDIAGRNSFKYGRDEMCNVKPKKRRFRVITDDDLLAESKTPPMKTTVVAIFLLFFGVSFLMAGFVTFYRWGVYDAIPFWTLGGLTFIPGSYASAILFMTYMGKKGYHYNLIPSYDD